MKAQFLTIVTFPGDAGCIFIEGTLSTPNLPRKGECVRVPDKGDEYSFLNRGLPAYSADFGTYEVIEIDHLFNGKGLLRSRINFEVRIDHGHELECDWERLSRLSAEGLKVYLSDDVVEAYPGDKVKEFGYQGEEAEEVIRQLVEKLPSI